MEEGLRQAVLYIKTGNHTGLDATMRSLGKTTDPERVLAIFHTNVDSPDAPYFHFLGFKLFSYQLTRNSAFRSSKRDIIYQFLMEYANYLLLNVATHLRWKPVISEFASSFATFLKLRCITVQNTVDKESVQNAVRWLYSFASCAHTSPDASYLYRILVQRSIEEFGLFDPLSRCRGLPMDAHRCCRTMFNTEGFLPLVAKAVLWGMLTSPHETTVSTEAGLRCLISCFSWFLHSFFQQESPSDEYCEIFEVTHPNWDELLLFESFSTSGLQGAQITLFDLLRNWFDQNSLRGVPVKRRHLAEICSLLCSFKNSMWGSLESLKFVKSCFYLSVDLLEKVIATNDMGEYHLLFLLTNGIYHLVLNFTELFLQPCLQTELMKLAEMTEFFVSWDTSNYDEDVMSSLNEAMNIWVCLVTFVDRVFSVETDQASLSLLQNCCHIIFSAFLSSRTTACLVDEDENGISDSLTNSHLDRVAHIARGCPTESFATVTALLQRLSDSLPSLFSLNVSTGVGSSQMERISEGLWILLKIIAFFIADPGEGEQPCIPRCFTKSATSNCHALKQLMETLFSLYLTFSTLNIGSTAVISAFMEVINRYVRTYVEAEDCSPVYTEVLGDGTLVVGFALKISCECIEKFPYDSTVMHSVCNVLESITEKSAFLLVYASSLSEYMSLLERVREPNTCHFAGTTRGYLLSFLLSCWATHGQLNVKEYLGSLLVVTSETSLERILDCVYTLRGFFESTNRQNIIQASCDFFFSSLYRLFELSFSKFHEPELIVQCIQCARVVFSKCTPLVENKRIGLVLELVELVMGKCCEDMKSVMTWHSTRHEKNKIDLLTAIASLIVLVAQWKALDCFLPDNSVQSLANTTVITLACLLDNMDGKMLCYPELVEVTFCALDLCADSFTFSFVNSSHCRSFHSAIVYALTAEQPTLQRVGIAVATKMSGSLASSQAPNSIFLVDYVKAMIDSLISCRFTLTNFKLLSKALLNFIKQSSLASTLGIFSTASEARPELRPFLDSIRNSISSCVSIDNDLEAQRKFEECLEMNFSLIKASSIF